MKAEIIAVGSELTSGFNIDTNSSYLSQKLFSLGIEVLYITCVGDKVKLIKTALETAFNRCDLILLTGGLGPTEDDLNREIISSFCKKKLVFRKEHLRRLKSFFKSRALPWVDDNLKQFYIPEGAKVIENKFGTALGFILEHEQKLIIALPGVPAELKLMFESKVLAFLREKLKAKRQFYQLKILKLIGLSEAQVNQKIADLFKSQTNPFLGIYAKPGEIQICLFAKASSKKDALRLNNLLKAKIEERLKSYIYAEDEETLERIVATILQQKGLTLSCAESCTAGLLAATLTQIPGSSSFFKGGIIAYANEIKEELLAVSNSILKKFGAVSKECAEVMAKTCREKLKTDLAISITGIAGPTGGNRAKPVGLVYFGLAWKTETFVFRKLFSGDRESIRLKAVRTALFILFEKLKNLALN